jgi:methanethiol oxidase
MGKWRPDPTFYASPSLAMKAAPEELAYVALLNVGGNGRKDAIGVVDANPESETYGRLVGQAELPDGDNELHHFGWNACSSHLCPYAPHAHVERRYLIVPGTQSSRIHILDTKPDPRNPRLVKVIDGAEVAEKTGYATLHTVHCGPEGVYLNALGTPTGDSPQRASSDREPQPQSGAN